MESDLTAGMAILFIFPFFFCPEMGEPYGNTTGI
jgi:hypothetical protein